jgi:hypothetical protein
MQNVSQAYHNSFYRDRTLCSPDIMQEMFVRMAEFFGQWPDTAGTAQMYLWTLKCIAADLIIQIS